MSRGMANMRMSDLDSLSGEAFDAKFLELMSRHHEGALAMSGAALEKSEHAELKALAQQIADVQRKEIDMMAQWRSAWVRSGS